MKRNGIRDRMKKFCQCVSQKEEKIGRFIIHLDKIKVNESVEDFSYVSIRDGVTVLPVVNSENIVAIRQYRYPIKKWTLELPGGVIEANEQPEEAAIRELEEETGYKAASMIPLGVHYPSFGATDEKVFLFAAMCDKKEMPKLDCAEEIVNEVMCMEEFETKINAEEIEHASAIIAWYRYKAYLAKYKMNGY